MTNHDTDASLPTIIDETCRAAIMQSQLPILAHVSAEQCAPYRLMHGVLSQLTVKLQGQLRMATVDVDRNPVHAGPLGVRGMPTLFLFRDGKFLS